MAWVPGVGGQSADLLKLLLQLFLDVRRQLCHIVLVRVSEPGLRICVVPPCPLKGGVVVAVVVEAPVLLPTGPLKVVLVVVCGYNLLDPRGREVDLVSLARLGAPALGVREPALRSVAALGAAVAVVDAVGGFTVVDADGSAGPHDRTVV